MSIKVSPDEFAADLRKRIKAMPATIKRGLIAGAHRGANVLRARTPVVSGRLKQAWRVNPIGKAPSIENDAPYAGVVEAGARPHRMSQEAIEALARWCRLRLGLGPEEALEAANAIAWRIRTQGQKPTYFVRDSIGELREVTAAEVAAAVAAEADRKAR